MSFRVPSRRWLLMVRMRPIWVDAVIPETP